MKRLVLGVVAVITVLTGLVATPATAAPLTAGFYKTAYDDTVYLWSTQGGQNRHVAITLEEYVEAGSPPVRTIASDYVKYPWTPALWAVTYWPGEAWQWDRLDGVRWARAGYPAPRAAGWIEGSYLARFDTSNELFLIDPDGTWHKLTLAEWDATGRRDPRTGYGTNAKYPFLPTIYRSATGDTVARTVSYDEWAALDYPTPSNTGRIVGDRWTRPAGDPRITLTTPDGQLVPITYEMWASVGFPQPEVV